MSNAVFPTLPRLMAILLLGPLVGFLVYIALLVVGSLFDGDASTQPGGILGGTILIAVLGAIYLVPTILVFGLPGSAFATVAFAVVSPFIKSRRTLAIFCLFTGFFATSAAWTIYHGANLLLGLLTGVDMPPAGSLPTASLFDFKDYVLAFGLPGAIALLVTGATRTL